MGKNKLKKFAEMETFHNVFQCSAHEVLSEQQSVRIAGRWREEYFKNDRPIVLELGCGRGDYTVGLAKMFPDRNFIGVDIKGARIWAGAKEAEMSGMTNVAFLRTNIEMITAFFDSNEVDEIWITFPDPQMKKATKRLTSTFFLERYERIIKPGGKMHLKTDSPFLYTYTRAMLRLNAYPIWADTADLYAEPQAENLEQARCLQTHYEHQWLDRGMTIKYVSWSLIPKADKKEPDIEIEKDSYRSYGRNYAPVPPVGH